METVVFDEEKAQLLKAISDDEAEVEQDEDSEAQGGTSGHELS